MKPPLTPPVPVLQLLRDALQVLPAMPQLAALGVQMACQQLDLDRTAGAQLLRELSTRPTRNQEP